jgi:uncharacterized protein (DUF1330 family)
MPAYVMFDIQITDPEGYKGYISAAAGTAEGYGGRFLVQAGHSERLEGDWEPSRMVVLEFPSLERARAWYESEEYRSAKAIRQRTARSSVVLVEGVSEGG